MRKPSPQIVILLLVYLTGSLGSCSTGVGKPKIRCKEAERRALLKIKEDLQEHAEDGVLSSWGREEEKRECCEWIGIRCGNKSGQVVTLDLSPSTFARYDLWSLEGNISSSLVDLQYLKYLDLSGIFLYGNSIPSFIGTLSKLRYLNLSHTFLRGEIPPQLGNLSSLRFLDLSRNNYQKINIKNFKWVQHLSSLRLLDLSHTNMSLAKDWVHVVNNLPHLIKLNLSGCDLPDIVPQSSHSLVNSSKVLAILDLSLNPLSASVFQWLYNYSHTLVHLDLYGCKLECPLPIYLKNMAALTYLDLSHNEIKGSIPQYIRNMTAIAYLALGRNHLEGSIPEAFGLNKSSLEYLDLSYNKLEGKIPKSFWKICTLRNLLASNNSFSGGFQLVESASKCGNFSLEYVDLGNNRIMGSLPNFTLYPYLEELHLSSNQISGNVSKSIGQLSQLKTLDISQNSMEGVMSESHFSKLFNLNHLDLSSNPHLVLNIHSDWIPPFQLEYIHLRSCKLGPSFPKWFQTQNKSVKLDISNSGISDFVPNWFWNLSTHLLHMNLSNNQMGGTIGNYPLEGFDSLLSIDLSMNQFEGPLPLFSNKVVTSYLSNNKFSSLNSLCEATEDTLLSFLDVSYNQLAGELPDCWSHFTRLEILLLTNNKLSGKIPSSVGSLSRIQMFHLGNNNLIGQLPSSLNKCRELTVLDVGENRLEGPIPTWIGESLPYLSVLSLRSNRFNGSMPSSLCYLVYIQLLDLSSNDIDGSIPNCFNNFIAMKKKASIERIGNGTVDSAINDTSITLSYNGSINGYDAQVALIWKGKLSYYKSTLRLVKSIDLSSNKLAGEIPTGFTELIGLVSLNLSRNNLSGQIPETIGQLKSLDALDLSRNHLSGKIPSSLSEVDRLNFLDLSSNNLSGKIPTSTQLQSFDSSTYMGNFELCGPPLTKNCPEEESTTSTETQDQETFISRGFYISMGLGFVVGFWGLCGTLVFVKSWRYEYIKFLNIVGDRIYVTVALQKVKLSRMITS